MNVQDAVMSFMHHLEANGRTRKTIYGYQSDLRRFQSFYEKRHNTEWYVEETTPEDIELFLWHLYEVEHLKPASRNRILNSLKSFYKYLHNRELCPKNPTISVKNIRYKRRERVYLTEHEYKEFINAIEHPVIRLATETLWYSGLRIGELVQLSLQDVKLDENLFHVRGKGDTYRDVPIHPELKGKLLKYRDEKRSQAGPWDWFFATQGSGRLSASFYNTQLHKTTRKLRWEKKITAHVFRHSFATNLMNAGVHIVVIQKLLGHETVDITSLYAHADFPSMSAAVNKL